MQSGAALPHGRLQGGRESSLDDVPWFMQIPAEGHLGCWWSLPSVIVMNGPERMTFCVFASVSLQRPFHAVSTPTYTQSRGVGAVVMVLKGHGHGLPTIGGKGRCACDLCNRRCHWQGGPAGFFH